MGESVRAAVVEGAGIAPAVCEVELDDLAADEVLVRLAVTGICHTDISWAAGNLFDEFPVVLGHESAGTVSEVGSSVTRFAPGNRVVLALSHHCGHCRYCETGRPMLCPERVNVRPRLFRAGQPVVQGHGTGGFAEATIVRESTPVRIPDGVPLQVAAIMGCAVATGVGAVVNIAQVRPGSTVLVIGCGGVGASVVMGAKLAGAEKVVAVEPKRDRRKIAESVGATEAVAPGDDRLRELVREGFDYSFECTGDPAQVDLSIGGIRPGGTATLIGVPVRGSRASFEMIPFIAEQKRVIGCITGNVRPSVDIPAWSRLYLRGMLPLDAVVTGSVALEEITEGFARSIRGEGLRTVVTLDQEPVL